MGCLDDAYLGWFDTEAVTLRGLENDRTTEFEQPVSIAKRRAASNTERNAAGLAMESTSVAFRLPVALLAGYIPRPTYTILDAQGRVYLIHSAELLASGSHYACITTEDQ